jgi:anthranilate phosphoribosyltransferase
MNNLLESLIEGKDLTETEAMSLMDEIMEGRMPPVRAGGVLTALRIKGETVAEIAGCARAMRGKALPVDTGVFRCVDTCGTGGDGADTFNVSTAAAFVLVAAGVPVAKHGNRSVSSRCGSADVLEALGANADLPPEAVSACLRRTGMGFMFAPRYHQAMKNAMPVRRELGVRTVFNILGPLTNPAGVRRQVLGVYDERLVRPLAETLRALGHERAMVVHGLDGLDELTVAAGTRVSELMEDGSIHDYTLEPESLGIDRADPSDLRGGDASENAEIIRAVLSGWPGPCRDIVALNAAAALVVAGRADSLSSGLALAGGLLDGGDALRVVRDFCACTRSVS